MHLFEVAAAHSLPPPFPPLSRSLALSYYNTRRNTCNTDNTCNACVTNYAAALPSIIRVRLVKVKDRRRPSAGEISAPIRATIFAEN